MTIRGYNPHKIRMRKDADDQIAKPMEDLDPTARLLAEVESYLIDRGVTESFFGREAMSDHKLIPELRNGRELRKASRLRVRKYIADNPVKEGAPT